MHKNEMDAEAFDRLYTQYNATVYRNIVKYIKEQAVAEDILQEAFIKLWERRGKIRKGTPVLGLLCVISYHLCVDYTRKKLRRQTVHDLLECNNVCNSECNNEYDYVCNKEYLLLNKALEKLSPQKRRVITLCKLQGKTYVEAAHLLHISPHTVKEYLSGAIVDLNTYLCNKL